MEKISKALGAAGGGAVLGAVAMPFLPDGTPWWGYLLGYALAVGLPMLGAYVAPKNAP